MQRGAIALYSRFEFQTFALRQDGDTVFTDAAAQQNLIAGTRVVYG